MTFPRSHREATVRLRQQYDQDIASGHSDPFVYPIATVGIGFGLLFFFIPPSSRFHNLFTRYLAFAIVAAGNAYIVARCEGMNPSTGFGTGGISTFGSMWAATLLVFTDAKATFKKLQRRPRYRSMNGYAAQDGITGGDANSSISAKSTDQSPATDDEPQSEYYWEPYPEHSFRDRAWWILDLWTNFRLLGWDQKLVTMPTYPIHVQSDLARSSKREVELDDQSVTKAGLRRYDSHDDLIRHNLWVFLKGYIILDVVCTLTRHDAFFRGAVDAPPPAGLPRFMLDTPGLWVTGYRLVAGMIFIWLGLRNILVLAPILIAGVLPASLIGTWTEPWLYPDHYGNYSIVLSKGLAGWWGGWWHQSFRCAFLAASDWLTDVLGVPRKAPTAKVITLLTSFFLSGVLHAGGSSTQPGPTRPLRGPMLFFMLQPLGIAAEMGWHSIYTKTGMKARVPWWLSYTANFVWVHAWFWLTAPLLVEDMAKGGLWLYQPVPFSPMRALGFGEKGDGVFCWDGPVARWHEGRRWWTSGLAL